MVKLLPYDFEVRDSSCRNSLLQYIKRLRTIDSMWSDPSSEFRIGGNFIYRTVLFFWFKNKSGCFVRVLATVFLSPYHIVLFDVHKIAPRKLFCQIHGKKWKSFFFFSFLHKSLYFKLPYISFDGIARANF